MKEHETTASPEQQIAASRVFGFIGIALLTCFFLTIAYSIHENAKTITVQGVVKNSSVHHSTSGSDDEKYTSYGHTFEYEDKNGVVRLGSDNGQRQSRFKKGSVVTIGYYPDDTSRIRIHSWFGQWKLQLVLLGLGLFLIWYMVVAVRQVRAKASTSFN